MTPIMLTWPGDPHCGLGRGFRVLGRHLALITLTLAPAYVSGFDLKGVEPGMTVATLNARFPAVGCAPEAENCTFNPTAIREPTGLDKLGDQSVRSWKFDFGEDRRLTKITVDFFDDYFEPDQLLSAMMEKYGKPREIRATSRQNAFGAKFPVLLRQWTDRRDVLTFANIPVTATTRTTMVTLESKASQRRELEREQQEVKRKAKDL